MALDEPNEMDVKLTSNEIDIIYDPQAASFVQNSVIDFSKSFLGSSFSIVNDGASTC